MLGGWVQPVPGVGTPASPLIASRMILPAVVGDANAGVTEAVAAAPVADLTSAGLTGTVPPERALMLATTVPSLVMPLTATLYGLLPVTTAVSVPGALLALRSISELVKTDGVMANVAVKLIGPASVGSVWPAALTRVALPRTSNETAAELDTGNGAPVASVAEPAGTLTRTRPAPDMPVTATLYGPVPVTTAASVPPTVLPVKLISALVKPVAGLENVTVKLTGPADTGLFWPAARVTLTVRPPDGATTAARRMKRAKRAAFARASSLFSSSSERRNASCSLVAITAVPKCR